MDDVVLVVGRVLNGLLAGIYVGFLVAVMPALHGLPDDVFVRVMNRINVVIVNPFFLVLFLGAPVLAAASVWWHRSPVAVGALVAAVVAVLLTAFANIPLNDTLAATGDRGAFETPWLIWHALRTTSAVAAFALLCVQAASR